MYGGGGVLDESRDFFTILIKINHMVISFYLL
jgi:hypothetical protein